MTLLATILVLAGSFFGNLLAHHTHLSDEGMKDDLVSLLYAAIWIGGTLGGIGLFLKLTWLA